MTIAELSSIQPPRFSLIIPAHNESAWLPALLDSVAIARANFRGGAALIEVIVGNNQSTDDTAAIAAARGCKVAHIEKRAIAAARNGGAAIASGEWLCFIDADSRIHPQSFNAIDDLITQKNIVVGATGVRPDRYSLGIICTWLCALPVIYLTQVDSGIVFCRREDFLTIGGYDEDMQYAEDIQLLQDLKKLGKSRGQTFARPNNVLAITSTRKFDKYGDWHYFTRMPRVGFWMLIDKRRVEKFTRAYWYDDRA